MTDKEIVEVIVRAIYPAVDLMNDKEQKRVRQTAAFFMIRLDQMGYELKNKED